MLERKYSKRELLTAHFEPYDDFFPIYGGSGYLEILKLQPRIALTLKNASVSKEVVRDLFAPMCHFLCIGREMCEGGEPGKSSNDLHIYLQLRERQRLLDIHRLANKELR
eukprot:8134406-Karenia_brevis.AAC.1